MYSIPIRHPNSSFYSTLFPEQTYLATSTTRQRYTTTSFLKKCKIFEPERRVCKDLPIYNFNSRPICEVSILQSTNKNLPDNCELTTFSAHIDTFQPLGNNQWIFILKFNTPYVVECGEDIQHQEISGSGIISLSPGCKFYTAFVTLNAEENSLTNVTHPIVMVNIEDACTLDTLQHSTPPELQPISIRNVPLDSLNAIKYQIKVQNQLLKDQQKSFNTYNSSSNFSFAAMALGSSMLIFLIFKWCPWHRFWSLIRKHPATSNETATPTGCIQIFNNCFDNSQRHHIIPMTTINSNTFSEDEDEEDDMPTPNSRSRTPKARSLF